MTNRWAVTRTFGSLPYRVEIAPEDALPLGLTYLDFCLVPRQRDQIQSMLSLMCDCPPDRIGALQLTLHTRLFLARGGRLIDDDFLQYKHGSREPLREWTTELGRAYLERSVAQRRLERTAP